MQKNANNMSLDILCKAIYNKIASDFISYEHLQLNKGVEKNDYEECAPETVGCLQERGNVS